MVTMLKVRQVMTASVVTISPDTLVKDASALLAEKTINRVPVVEKNLLVGIVTRGDVIRGLAKEGAQEKTK